MRKMIMENQVLIVFFGDNKYEKEYLHFSEYALY